MKSIIRKRLERLKHRSRRIDAADIQSAQHLLFCVLSRYGDGIISFKIINEFIKRHPNKKYLVLTSRQQLAYAREILGSRSNLRVRKVNKRSPLSFFTTVALLKREEIDIGFNPWGHGDDSEFFISFARRFFFYKSFDNFGKTFNLYDRVRMYLNLEIKKTKSLGAFSFDNIKHVVIAPVSTDPTKNLNASQISYLIELLNTAFPIAEITIAIPKSHRNAVAHGDIFLFRKSNANSIRFLEILKHSDLFIGVDSGPLHLALALGVRSLVIFGPTSPKTIFDDGHIAAYLRSPLLENTFCFVKDCPRPICISKDIISRLLTPSTEIDDEAHLESVRCSMEPEK